jgi:hypothetical protein
MLQAGHSTIIVACFCWHFATWNLSEEAKNALPQEGQGIPGGGMNGLLVDRRDEQPSRVSQSLLSASTRCMDVVGVVLYATCTVNP